MACLRINWGACSSKKGRHSHYDAVINPRLNELAMREAQMSSISVGNLLAETLGLHRCYIDMVVAATKSDTNNQALIILPKVHGLSFQHEIGDEYRVAQRSRVAPRPKHLQNLKMLKLFSCDCSSIVHRGQAKHFAHSITIALPVFSVAPMVRFW